MELDPVFLQYLEDHAASVCAAVLVVVLLLWRRVRDAATVDALHDKHVLITGCDSGFGRLLAQRLDRRDFNVIAACMTSEGASELSSASSRRLRTVVLDVTDGESIRRATEFVSAEVGERGLWGLVNNAGRSLPIGPVDWLRLEDFVKVLDVNLLGVVGVTLQFLPLLKKGRGRVVNVASILGRISFVSGGYCLSKYGVEAFTDALRLEMRHFGINVSMIEPGFFHTTVTRLDHMEENLKVLWARLPQDVRDDYGAEYIAEYMKKQAFSLEMLCSSDLSKVTGCMERALTARRPRARYSAGWDAKLLWLPLSYCPTVVADFFCGMLFPNPKLGRA